MRSGLIEFFKRAFHLEPKLHPLDRRVATRWIKQRLAALFPELRGNPQALEQAYRGLSLEPRLCDRGGETIFELTLPWKTGRQAGNPDSSQG